MKKLAILFISCLIFVSSMAESSPNSDQMISIGTHSLKIHMEGKGVPTVVNESRKK